MKNENLTEIPGQSMSLVPQDFLINLMHVVNEIKDTVQAKEKQTDTIGDYISEADAKKILGRKTTWFWALRKSGKIPFTKVGNKIWYSKADLLNFIEGKSK